MDAIHYVGFDVHKKSVSFCVKRDDSGMVAEVRLPAARQALRQWAPEQRVPWRGAMEATLFSGWIYDTLKPHAVQLDMGHPALMKAIGAAKNKSDRLDARWIADLVRCNLLPVCYVAPPAIRDCAKRCATAALWCSKRYQCKTKLPVARWRCFTPCNGDC